MSKQSDIKNRVIGIVRDDSGKLIDPDDFDRIINAAINKYSKYRPALKVADVAGNGTHDYALPTGWIDEFSAIRNIEYPLGDVPESLLNGDDYAIYQSPTDKKIRLIRYSPAATESFRVTFTIPRTDATIPDNDVDALCNLAAAFCLEELANLFTQTSDPNIAADVVNYRTKSFEFTARAKRLMQLCKEHMGLKDEDITPPASAVTDLDIKYPGGGDRLTHSRYGRRRR